MNHAFADKKKTNNESFFRTQNERAKRGIDETNEIIRDANDGTELFSEDIELHFSCECADEDCNKSVPLSLRIYTELHKNRKNFIVLPGHQVENVERILEEKPAYTVVQKFIRPDEDVMTLSSTEIQNS